MRNIIIAACVALTACSSAPSGTNTTVTALCKADVNAPAAVQAGGQIAVTVDPLIAPDVALASAIDLLVHPLVQNACGAAGVASVTTIAVPTP